MILYCHKISGSPKHHQPPPIFDYPPSTCSTDRPSSLDPHLTPPKADVRETKYANHRVYKDQKPISGSTTTPQNINAKLWKTNYATTQDISAAERLRNGTGTVLTVSTPNSKHGESRQRVKPYQIPDRIQRKIEAGKKNSMVNRDCLIGKEKEKRNSVTFSTHNELFKSDCTRRQSFPQSKWVPGERNKFPHGILHNAERRSTYVGGYYNYQQSPPEHQQSPPEQQGEKSAGKSSMGDGNVRSGVLLGSVLSTAGVENLVPRSKSDESMIVHNSNNSDKPKKWSLDATKATSQSTHLGGKDSSGSFMRSLKEIKSSEDEGTLQLKMTEQETEHQRKEKEEEKEAEEEVPKPLKPDKVYDGTGLAMRRASTQLWVKTQLEGMTGREEFILGNSDEWIRVIKEKPEDTKESIAQITKPNNKHLDGKDALLLPHPNLTRKAYMPPEVALEGVGSLHSPSGPLRKKSLKGIKKAEEMGESQENDDDEQIQPSTAER